MLPPPFCRAQICQGSYHLMLQWKNKKYFLPPLSPGVNFIKKIFPWLMPQFITLYWIFGTVRVGWIGSSLNIVFDSSVYRKVCVCSKLFTEIFSLYAFNEGFLFQGQFAEFKITRPKIHCQYIKIRNWSFVLPKDMFAKI